MSESTATSLRRIGVRPSLRAYVADLWVRRDFVLTVAIGDFKAQNQNTVLGSLWHLLNPMLLAAVYYLVFGIIFGARGDIENYPAFLVTGIIVFTYTTKSMTGGAKTIINSMSLMKAISFPRASMPIAATMTETLGQLSALAALAVFVVLTGVRPQLTWLLVVPAMGIQALFNLGTSFMTARATFHFRDVQQFLPYVLRIWLYLSGVMFSVDFVDAKGVAWVSTLFRLNPMYGFMRITRDALLYGQVAPKFWLVALAWALFASVFGFMFFWRREMDYSRG